jgi:hypothetical protein
MLGELESENMPVHVFRSANSADYDGLIGSDVFSRFRITIDFPAFKMKLAPFDGPPWDPEADAENSAKLAEGYWPVLLLGAHLVIPAMVNRKGEGRLFLIDSGSTSTWSWCEGHWRSGQRSSIANRVDLYVAGLHQQNTDMVAIDLTKMSDAFGTAFSGVLGMPVLGPRRLTLDYRNVGVRFKLPSTINELECRQEYKPDRRVHLS